MIFLTEVSPVLWATGVYWIPGASLHRQHPHHSKAAPVFSRSWEGILLSGQWWGVVLKQSCMTDYNHPSAYYIECDRFLNNFNIQLNIF